MPPASPWFSKTFIKSWMTLHNARAVVIPEAETGDFWTSCREVEEGFKPKIWTPVLVTRVVVVVTKLVVERNIYEKNI